MARGFAVYNIHFPSRQVDEMYLPRQIVEEMSRKTKRTTPHVAQTSVMAIVFAALLGHFLATDAVGGMTDAHYEIATANGLSYSFMSGPSVNDQGDLVLRGRNSVGSFSQIRSFLYNSEYFDPLNPLEPYDSVLIAQERVTTAFPAINKDRDVAAAYSDSSFTQGFLQRYNYDLNSGTYSAIPTTIARWDILGPTASRPFFDVVRSVSLRDTDEVTFYSGAPGVNPGIFEGSAYISNPTNSAIASPLNGINSVEQGFDAANGVGGYVVRGETASNGLGIYRGTAATTPILFSPVATAGTGFLATGSRPSINEMGTIAYYGQKTSGETGVFLNFSGGTERNTSEFGTIPASFDALSRVSLNEFNQVAYLGTNVNGDQALYSTNLGATREIIAVGDVFEKSSSPMNPDIKVSSITFHDGLMKSGQLVYLINTDDGEQRLVRTNRAYTQGNLSNSPIPVPWSGTEYLLRSVSGSPFPDIGKTISSDGCNLTTTVNLLSYYGSSTTPGAFQNWLIAGYQSPGTYPKTHFITEYIENGQTKGNDFHHHITKDYSQFLFSAGAAQRIVQYDGLWVGPTANSEKLLSELALGYAVKLQVPSTLNPDGYGHFVLAYGLTDPSIATFDPSNILIMDPGHPSRLNLSQPREINTLADYNTLIGKGNDYGWLDNPGKGRLHLYRAYDDPDSVPPPQQFWGLVRSPVEIVLTDPLGRRLGIDPVIGSFSEIPGGTYYTQEPYAALDSSEFVGDEDEITVFHFDEPLIGDYSLEVIGIGDGDFQITLSALGLVGANGGLLEGMIQLGERLVYDFAIAADDLPGDFDFDGDVDGSDFLKWQRGEVSSPPSASELAAWEANYGMVGPLTASSAAVPEPASALLVLAAACSPLRWRLCRLPSTRQGLRGVKNSPILRQPWSGTFSANY